MNTTVSLIKIGTPIAEAPTCVKCGAISARSDAWWFGVYCADHKAQERVAFDAYLVRRPTTIDYTKH